MTTLPVIRELDGPYLEGIGAVCFEWALLERELSLVAYMLLRLGPKQGRVAVRSPRANDSVTMIRQLLSLEKLEVKEVDLVELGKVLTKLQTLRDQIAHGIFLKAKNGQILIQNFSGNWKPDPAQDKVSRRIKPEGIATEAQDLKEIAKLIRACIVGVHMTGLEIARARGASQSEFQQQSEQDRPQGDVPA